MIITSRGCPFACSYCCNNLLHSLYEDERCHIRRLSPGHVLKELVEARSFSDRIRSVAFVDDIFTNSKAWLEEFIPKYKTHVNLPFYCNIHSAGFSLEKARLLKDGGCQLVIVGVQSGSERIRLDIFLRRETNESILQAVGYLKAVGIRFAVDHIFGAPGETNEDLEQSFDFYKQIQPDMLQSFWLTYYPGTDIIKTARKQGLLSAEDVHRINDGNIGFAHGVGCVDRERIPLCKQYELFFGLCTLIRNPRTLTLLCSIFRWMPFKKVVSLCIYTVVGLKHFRPWVLNKFRYAFSAHTAP